MSLFMHGKLAKGPPEKKIEKEVRNKMENYSPVCDASLQLKAACEKIQILTTSIDVVKDDIPELADVYRSMRRDEMEHIQMLMVILTSFITDGDVNIDDDGSVFFEGELTDEIK